jgi:hypothetical protein
MTTNFIPARAVKPGGVGRYFLDRAAMAARSIDEALAICQHPARAFAFHHVIASVATGRAVSLEATAGHASVQELGGGLWLHTNHLVHPALAAEPQDERAVSRSSLPRLRTLARWRAGRGSRGLDGAAMVEALTSHEGRPYSPCRHPTAEVRGATLLTAVFDCGARSVRWYDGPPCAGAWRELPLVTPAPGHP